MKRMRLERRARKVRTFAQLRRHTRRLARITRSGEAQALHQRALQARSYDLFAGLHDDLVRLARTVDRARRRNRT